MTPTTRTATIIAVALLIGTGGAIALQSTQIDAQQAETQSTSSIEVTDQVSDNQTVIVDNVTLAEGGFVVIHNDSFQTGSTVDSAIGVSTYLEAGSHESVPVTLAEPVDVSSITVIAVAHTDSNSNEAFDYVTSNGSVDGPYSETTEQTQTETPTATASPVATPTETETETATETETSTPTATQSVSERAVQDAALVTVDTSQGPQMNLAVANESQNESTVTVDRVTMYRGGFIAVHESSDGEDVGDIIGTSTYLAPGTHENVEVTLSQSLNMTDGDDVTLIVMPHQDTNSNHAFDFVIADGETDGPYVANGSAVTATVNVTSDEAADTATTTETTTETES